MEWLDGETLAGRMARAPGSLSIDDALRYATQIADGADAVLRFPCPCRPDLQAAADICDTVIL
jgi:hypothetical protein